MPAYTHISAFDIGIQLRAHVYYPLHDAACAKFILRPARSQSLCELPADIIDVNEGVIQYISQEKDFETPGEYRIQAHIVFKDGSQLTGAVHKFKVHEFFE